MLITQKDNSPIWQEVIDLYGDLIDRLYVGDGINEDVTDVVFLLIDDDGYSVGWQLHEWVFFGNCPDGTIKTLVERGESRRKGRHAFRDLTSYITGGQDNYDWSPSATIYNG
jgi:hypothetical protein